MREQFYERNVDLNVIVDGVDRPTSAEASGPSSPSDSSSILPDLPTNLDSGLDSVEPQGNESDKDIEARVDFSTEHIEQEDSTQTIKLQPGVVNSQRHLTNNRWQVPKSQRSSHHGPHMIPNLHTSKPESVRKLGPSKDRSLLNGSKVWTKKLRIDSDGEKLKPPPLQGETSHQIKENNCEVIIGSIPVTLNGCVAQNQDSSPDAQDIKSTEHTVPKKKNASDKPIKSNATIQAGTNRVASKLWRPVSRRESKNTSLVDRGNDDSEGAAMLENGHDQIPPAERHENAQQECLPFSSVAAKEFLAQSTLIFTFHHVVFILYFAIWIEIQRELLSVASLIMWRFVRSCLCRMEGSYGGRPCEISPFRTQLL